MRLIDADALCMELAEWQLEESPSARDTDIERIRGSITCDVIDEVICAIDNALTIDAVPKAQCLDCQFNGKYGGIDLRKINATG